MGTHIRQELNEETRQLQTVEKKPVKQIIDLSAECLQIFPKKRLQPIFMPSFLDQTGNLHIIEGLMDSKPNMTTDNIQELLKI